MVIFQVVRINNQYHVGDVNLFPISLKPTHTQRFMKAHTYVHAHMSILFSSANYYIPVLLHTLSIMGLGIMNSRIFTREDTT